MNLDLVNFRTKICSYIYPLKYLTHQPPNGVTGLSHTIKNAPTLPKHTHIFRKITRTCGKSHFPLNARRRHHKQCSKPHKQHKHPPLHPRGSQGPPRRSLCVSVCTESRRGRRPCIRGLKGPKGVGAVEIRRKKGKQGVAVCLSR